MAKNWNPLKSAFLAVTDNQNKALFLRRVAKIETEGLDLLDGMLATTGPNRLHNTHPQRATFEGHATRIRLLVTTASQVVDNDKGQSRRQYDGLKAAKDESRQLKDQLTVLVAAQPTDHDDHFETVFNNMERARGVDRSLHGVVDRIEQAIRLKAQTQTHAEAWDFDLAAALHDQLSDAVDGIFDIEQRHGRYVVAAAPVLEQYAAVRDADVTGIDLLKDRRDLAKVALDKVTEAVDGGQYDRATGLLTTALRSAIASFHEAGTTHYQRHHGIVLGDHTAIDNKCSAEKAGYEPEHSTMLAARKTAEQHAAAKRWAPATRAVTGAWRDAVDGLVRKHADVKKDFEDTVAPLRQRATTATSNSSAVAAMATMRTDVIDRAKAIVDKDSAGLFVSGKALLGAFDTAIQKVEDTLTAKGLYDSASNAPLVAYATQEPLATFAVAQWGTSAAGTDLKNKRQAMVDCHTALEVALAAADFVTAKAKKADLGPLVTEVKQELVTTNIDFTAHFNTELQQTLSDRRARLALLQTAFVGLNDKDGHHQAMLDMNTAITTHASPPSPDGVRAWKSLEDLVGKMDAVERVIFDHKAWRYNLAQADLRYDKVKGTSAGIPAIKGLHDTMVAARKTATDLESAGDYIAARAAVPAFVARIAAVEDSLAAKVAFEKAETPVKARETAALLVVVPEPVESVDSPLKAKKTTLVQARTAVKQKLDTGAWADAEALLPDLDNAASDVLSTEAKLGALGSKTPKTALSKLQSEEGGDALLADLSKQLVGTEPDTSPALKAVIELRFKVALTQGGETESQVWKSNTGVEAKTLATMFQLLCATELTALMGPLRQRFETAKTTSSGLATLSTAHGNMVDAEKAIKDKETAKAHGDGLDLVPAFESALVTVEGLLADHKAWKAAYDPVKERYDKALLIALPNVPVNSPDPQLVALNKDMKAAHKAVTDLSDAGQYAGALKKVAPLDDAVRAMFVQHATEGAATNPTAAVAALDGITPGGPKLLDAFIEDLDPTHAEYAEVLKAALEKRFKLTSVRQFYTQGVNELPETHTESLKHMYDLFNMVPDTHVRDNTHLTLLTQDTRKTGGAGYSFYPDHREWGRIDMYCGRPSLTGDYHTTEQSGNLGSTTAFPEPIEDDYQPANNDPVTYFDWAALHEVGHAVDWQARFMETNGSDVKYGEWTVYADNTAVVDAGTTHFKTTLDFGFGNIDRDAVLRDFVKATIEKSGPAVPPSPDASQIANTNKWTAAFAAIEKWGKISRSWGICFDGQASKRAVIGDYCYQEDEGKWNRYKWDTRKKGISGYQFRAPAEWFAELYAAYYTGKLKTSHPFNAVIRDNF